MKRATSIGCLIGVAGCLGAAATAGAMTPPASCQVPIAAMRKQLDTPTHIYATESSSELNKHDEPRESIYIGDAIYVQAKGGWKRSPMTVEQMRQQLQENMRNATAMTCTHVRDE